MRGDRGQATVEWIAVVLIVAVVLSGATYTMAAVDAPSFARSIRCAILAGCQGQDATLEAAYGSDAAALVRAYAPGIVYEPGTLTLPVDYRTCRSHRCSDAPDTTDDVRMTSAGQRATVFTRVVDHRPAGDLFIQYWLYYPDSTYNGPARAMSEGMPPGVARTPVGDITRRAATKVAGRHADDWESYQIRINSDGEILGRASAHHGYAQYRRWPNRNELPDDLAGERSGAWVPITGWTRVSRGSHAGHIVTDPGSSERRTNADGTVLVPIEAMAPGDREAEFDVTPPWRKRVYRNPVRNDT